MKTKSALVTLFLAAAPLHAQEWQSLSGIGDKLALRQGETALIVSVSDESYVKVGMPGRIALALRLHPRKEPGYLVTQVPMPAGRRDRVEVDWKHPVPVSGPCPIGLRTPTVMTLRIHGSRPAMLAPPR